MSTDPKKFSNLKSQFENQSQSQSLSSSTPSKSNAPIVNRSKITWRCGACTLLNNNSAAKCEACNVSRPMIIPVRNIPGVVNSDDTNRLLNIHSSQQNEMLSQLNQQQQYLNDLQQQHKSEEFIKNEAEKTINHFANKENIPSLNNSSKSSKSSIPAPPPLNQSSEHFPYTNKNAVENFSSTYNPLTTSTTARYTIRDVNQPDENAQKILALQYASNIKPPNYASSSSSSLEPPKYEDQYMNPNAVSVENAKMLNQGNSANVYDAAYDNAQFNPNARNMNQSNVYNTANASRLSSSNENIYTNPNAAALNPSSVYNQYPSSSSSLSSSSSSSQSHLNDASLANASLHAPVPDSSLNVSYENANHAKAGKYGFCVVCDHSADSLGSQTQVPICSEKCEKQYAVLNHIVYVDRIVHVPVDPKLNVAAPIHTVSRSKFKRFIRGIGELTTPRSA